LNSDYQITRRQCWSAIAGATLAALAPGLCLAEADDGVLSFAVSSATLAGTNLNDARAAYQIWINEILRDSGHTFARTVPGIFISSDEIVGGIRRGRIDCFGVTALEFAKVSRLVYSDEVVLQDYIAAGIEYVLLVRNDSPCHSVVDLKGRQVLSHLHRDMVLAPAWLTVLLAANKLGLPEKFWRVDSTHEKVNEVILPVFFRSADAACISRRNWETAVELNPQLGHDLRILAVSPKVIPMLIGFRSNCDAAARANVIESMLQISTTKVGQQITALYGTQTFVGRPSSVMQGTMEMVRQYLRISQQTTGSRKGNS
jgi:ABC-type phosphate/phosphonate transport system substrate-binding protein